MKGVIVYKGKYGATRQYAEWLSEDFLLPALSPEMMYGKKLHDYDFVIAGSPVYIGKIKLYRWLKQNEQELKNKKVFLFIVCATPTSRKDKLQEIEDQNVPPYLKDKCKVFFLHGRMIYKNLNGFDKFMLKMGSKLEKDPETKKGMLTDFDDVKKENTRELVQEVRSWLYGKVEPAELAHSK